MLDFRFDSNGREAVTQKELANKKQRFEHALGLFVSRIREDRYIIAVVLVGSLSDETIWRKDGLLKGVN